MCNHPLPQGYSASSLAGISLFIGGTTTIGNNNPYLNQTLSHEMGHCLGLEHTTSSTNIMTQQRNGINNTFSSMQGGWIKFIADNGHHPIQHDLIVNGRECGGITQ